jgi:ERCC4-related helicase
MFGENTRKIAFALSALNIEYGIVKGTRGQKDKVISDFRDNNSGVNVLLIQSSKDCAGIHLPEVSTLILYHYYSDVDVMQQVVGRAQRIGRNHSLEVAIIVTSFEARRLRYQ